MTRRARPPMSAPAHAVRRAGDRPYLASVPAMPDIPGITRLADVKSKRLRWLWTDRVPLGALSEMIADEGLGKSTLAARIIADATRGKLPGQDGEAMSVLVVAEEDGWQHTLKPRLEAAGGDMERVGLLQVPDGDGYRSVMLPGDTAFIAEKMAVFGARLLLIDPLGSHVKVKSAVDSDEVRRALAPLARAADDGDFAVLSIRHTNRSAGSNARSRSGSSIAYRQAARVQLIFGRDPDAPDDEWSRMLVGSKANHAGRARATRILLSLMPVDLDDGDTVDIICASFGASTHHTDTDVLKATSEDDTGVRGRPRTEIVIAEDYIARTLGNGTRIRATDFIAGAEAEGIKPTTLKRARKALDVKSQRSNGRMYVSLPPRGPKSAKGAKKRG
jgi:hypothetical protein